MKDLTIINHNGERVIDSREVAEMVDIQHKDLLEKIRGYVQILSSGVFRSTDFFIESSYQDNYNRMHPCFLITRKGCDMIANKLTGEKGVLFTAAYVEKFHEMKEAPPLPSMTQTQLVAAIAQIQVDHEQKLLHLESRSEKIERRLELVKNTFAKTTEEDWKEWARQCVEQIVEATSGILDYQDIWREAYGLLETRGKCNLSPRLRNMQNRMAETGATKTKINALRKLDVVEQEDRLREIFTAILKEMTARYVA